MFRLVSKSDALSVELTVHSEEINTMSLAINEVNAFENLGE